MPSTSCSSATPVKRPRPNLAALGLAIEGPVPLPGEYRAGTAGFRYWATAEALERVAALWRDDVAGPARGGARKVARQALDAAVISDDPVVVHAALLAFRTMAEEREAEAAVAQLRRLDPAADAALVRSAADLHDPEIYAKIAACGGQVGDASSQLSCLDRLTLPTSGAVAAQVAYQRVLFSGASDEIPDRQGRITVPAALREYAGLDRDVVVVGKNTTAEIWDTAAWTAYLADQEDAFSDLSEEVFPGI